jgi:hypothetical protein
VAVGTSATISVDLAATVGVTSTVGVLVGVGVSVGKRTTKGVTVGVGNKFCVGSGVAVTVGKRIAGGGNSPLAPAFRIAAVAVGVVGEVTSGVGEIITTSEMDGVAGRMVSVTVGVVATALVTVPVSDGDGSAVIGPKRASGETSGGGRIVIWAGPAAASVKPFASRKNTRVSSTRPAVMVRENMSMSVA